MWNVIVDGKVVTQILAWDRNDAWVYATRTYGIDATVERPLSACADEIADAFNAGFEIGRVDR